MWSLDGLWGLPHASFGNLVRVSTPCCLISGWLVCDDLRCVVRLADHAVDDRQMLRSEGGQLAAC